MSAVEQGFVQGEIEAAAYRWQRDVESGERVIVGVNEYVAESEQPIELQPIDPAAERRQRRAHRSAARRTQPGRRVERRSRRCGPPPAGTENLLIPMRAALRAHCTIGEICGVLREEWGEHDRDRAPR